MWFQIQNTTNGSALTSKMVTDILISLSLPKFVEWTWVLELDLCSDFVLPLIISCRNVSKSYHLSEPVSSFIN